MTAAGSQATRQRFEAPLAELMAEAAALRDSAHGRLISYSRKVFIPLTKLCRDVCHYCTFAEVPRVGRPVYLSPDEVLAIARAGAAAGCTEALFTLGDKPELRYRPARDRRLGGSARQRRRPPLQFLSAGGLATDGAQIRLCHPDRRSGAGEAHLRT